MDNSREGADLNNDNSIRRRSKIPIASIYFMTMHEDLANETHLLIDREQ